jgi:hypothetical protein
MNANRTEPVSSASKTPVRVFPFAGDGKWYWQDAYCDEPMGPFDSYRDAMRDYKDCRK